jgi:hypothetical protein
LAQYIGVFDSKARTATTSSRDFSSYEGGVGCICVINITAVTSSPSVTFTIQGKDPASGTYYTILASSAQTGAGQVILRVHPDLTASANAVAKDMMPAVWRVTATHGNTDSMTYTVGASIV